MKILPFFLMAALVVYGLAPLIKRLSKYCPLDAGLLIYLAFSLCVLIPPLEDIPRNPRAILVFFLKGMFASSLDPQIAGLLLGGGVITVAGLWVKRRPLSWKAKLGLQLIGAALVVGFGLKITFITNPLGGYIYLNHSVWPVTLAWLILVINAVSLIDRLDGLVVAIASILTLTLFVINVLQGESLPSVYLFASLAGAELAFLRYNFYPAALPLGETGGMTLGLLLGGLTILGVSKATTLLILIVPWFILGIPVALVAAPILYVYLKGRGEEGLFSRGGLVGGLTTPQTVFLVSFLCLVLSVLSTAFILKNTLISQILLLSAGLTAWLPLRPFFHKAPPPAHSASTPRVPILDVAIDHVTQSSALMKVKEFISSRSPHMVFTPNSLMILKAQSNSQLKQTLAKAHLLIPDGIGLLWAAEFYGTPLSQRVTGIDLLKDICRLSSREGYTISLLGSTSEVVKEAALNLSRDYPGLKVVSFHHGYFGRKDEEGIIAKIKQSSPDVLFVGLGLGRQERWIAEHLEMLGVPVCMGVGGSFDVIAGRLKRAPGWMMRHGLEWLYRLYSQPWRIKRILGLPRFVLAVFIHKIKLNDLKT
ncbi:MAG: WecB/TagA/CpsF family glycosyltransferase [bacterium]